jgi:hypothetical protein
MTTIHDTIIARKIEAHAQIGNNFNETEVTTQIDPQPGIANIRQSKMLWKSVNIATQNKCCMLYLRQRNIHRHLYQTTLHGGCITVL